jgi:hypothetical protein
VSNEPAPTEDNDPAMLDSNTESKGKTEQEKRSEKQDDDKEGTGEIDLQPNTLQPSTQTNSQGQ